MMTRWLKLALLALAASLALPLAAPVVAQDAAPAPGRGESLPDTLEAIEQARVVTRVLYIVAHPDDETSALLTYLAHGLGADTTLLTLTRGEGGQNAIGPEQGKQLAILRSAELSAAMEYEGPRLCFSRAPDFGFSKTLEETLKMWEGIALPDMVRVIRTVRPNIVVNGWGNQKTGHGNHQASGYLTPKAVEAAADPKQFPEQFAEGLKPWRVEMLFNPVRAQGGPGQREEKVDYTGSWVVPADEISPIWGRSYLDIAIEGFVHHRSQGVTPAINSPFVRRPYGLKPAGGGAAPTPADFAQPLVSLARLLPMPSAQEPLASADQALGQARAAAEQLDWPGAARALASAGKQIAALEDRLQASRDERVADALWELGQVRERIDHALADAAAVQIVSNADRSELVAGEGFSVRAEVVHRAGVPGTFSKPELVLPPGWSVTKVEEKDGTTNLSVAVPAGAEPPHSPADWMYPFPPPLVRARTRVEVEGYLFDFIAPVESRQATTTVVLSYPLRIVPAVSVTVEPQQFVVVEARQPKQFELFARVHSFAQSASKVSVGVDVPTGWKVPEAQSVEFTGAGDRLVRLVVMPPGKIAPGNYELKAYAKRGSETFAESLEPLPSLPTYLWREPSKVPVHAFAINVPERLRVGYVAAENDTIPESLRRVGIEVELLDAKALAFSDLGRFDAIVLGLRAYELRPDLVASNRRLLDYAAAGGTLVVQSGTRPAVWDKQKLAPYPSSLGENPPRVTDETATVKFPDPASPLLTFPNKIDAHDFDNWVQERGLYFWEKWDSQYHAVLSMHDPGEKDVEGGLVWARTGKGSYIYTGLSFSRQLPEGNAGAFRLFVNLLSQSRSKTK